MIEWIVIATILVVLFYTLWRAHVARVAPDEVDARQAALVIWKGRAAELAKRDDLTPEQRDRELDRLRAGVLADAGEQTRVSEMGPRSLGFLLSLGLLMVTALVGYQQLGGMTQVQLTLDARTLQADLDQSESLEDAIDIVQAAIERHALPERYYTLGQLFEQAGDLASAYEAYRSARERGELDQIYAEALPEFLSAEAQALLFSDRSQSDLAISLAGRSLSLDENNTIALGVLGVAAFDAQNFADAERYWSRLLALIPMESPDYQAILQGLEMARAALGQPVPSITLRVAAPNVDAPAQTPVFIYARASADVPTPLVVARVELGQLPLEITLNNQYRMGPMAGLPAQGQVEVVARVSLSGGVAPARGDWEGVARGVSTAQGQATLAIDTQL